MIKLTSGDSQLKLETPSLDALQSLLVYLKKHMNMARMVSHIAPSNLCSRLLIVEDKKYDGKAHIFSWIDSYLAQPGMP